MMLSFLALAITGLLTTWLCVALYRSTLHPLAKYPGPRLSAWTIWPHALAAMHGCAHERILRLHQQYGDIVRYTPDALSFNTAEALRDIYSNKSANVQKTGYVLRAQWNSGAAQTHTMVDRQIHAQKRKLLSHAFSEAALRSSEGYMLSRIREWCTLIYQRADTALSDKGQWRPCNFGVWTAFLALDVLGELCFGTSFGSMRTQDREVTEAMVSGSKFSHIVTYLPIPYMHIILSWIKKIRLLDRLGFKIGAQVVRFRTVLAHLVSTRIEKEKEGAELSNGAARKDFYHHLLHAEDSDTGVKYTPQELIGEAALLLVAGTDTSAATLSALIFYLTRQTKVLDKLVAEIRGTFNDVEEIKNGAQLQSLIYLKACVEEALRLSPPVPGVLEREILSGGATIDGHLIPQGYTVAVAAWAIHHNERYYDQPFEFIPERWISDSQSSGLSITRETVARGKSAFCAFSLGSRNCIGKTMAYLEIYLTIARLLYLYDVRRKEGDRTGEIETGPNTGNYKLGDWFVTSREGPMVEFIPR